MATTRMAPIPTDDHHIHRPRERMLPEDPAGGPESGSAGCSVERNVRPARWESNDTLMVTGLAGCESWMGPELVPSQMGWPGDTSVSGPWSGDLGVGDPSS